MAGMGPAPKPEDQRARRNATVGMTKLPAAGRTGRTPKWPLIPDIVTKARRDVAAGKVEALEYDLEEKVALGNPVGSLEDRLDRAREQLAIYEARLKEQRKIETAAWRELWKTPQAVAWQDLGWYREVAQYVRFRVLGELGDLDAAKEARQWSDRLGLNPLAMLRLRWQISDAPATSQQITGTTRAGSRSRYGDLRVISPGSDK